MSRLGCSVTKLFAIICLEDGGRTKYAKDLDEYYCHGPVCPGGQRTQLAEFDAVVLVVEDILEWTIRHTLVVN